MRKVWCKQDPEIRIVPRYQPGPEITAELVEALDGQQAETVAESVEAQRTYCELFLGDLRRAMPFGPMIAEASVVEQEYAVCSHCGALWTSENPWRNGCCEEDSRGVKTAIVIPCGGVPYVPHNKSTIEVMEFAELTGPELIFSVTAHGQLDSWIGGAPVRIRGGEFDGEVVGQVLRARVSSLVNEVSLGTVHSNAAKALRDRVTARRQNRRAGEPEPFLDFAIEFEARTEGRTILEIAEYSLCVVAILEPGTAAG